MGAEGRQKVTQERSLGGHFDCAWRSSRGCPSCVIPSAVRTQGKVAEAKGSSISFLREALLFSTRLLWYRDFLFPCRSSDVQWPFPVSPRLCSLVCFP